MTTTRAARSTVVLWVIPGVYFVFIAAEFGAMTHAALELTAAGRPALEVGALATALWGGILMASSSAHRLVQRLGHARTFVAATALATVALASMPWHARYPGWLAAAWAMGLGGGWVWVAGEAWLAEAAPRERRGFYVGLFETMVGLGLMAGPALVPLTRWLALPTLAVAAAVMALAWIASLWLLRQPAPGDDEDAAAAPAPGAASARALVLPVMAVAATSGLMESGVSALLPSISMRLGASVEAAALLGTVIGAGSALLQPPAGHLADRIGTRTVLLGAWAVVLVANALLLALAGDPGAALWGIGFALGGAGGAVYTLLVIELGHRLAGAALVRAVAALVTSYSVGTALGPMLGGSLFDGFGLAGLAAALAAASALGLALTLRLLRPQDPGPPPGGRPGARSGAQPG
jgi:MFS family permease